MGFFDFLTGGKDAGKTTVAADPYGDIRKPLIDWLKGQIGQPGPEYKGEMVAPMSDQEKQSFDFLRQYGETGYGDTFQNAKSEINKTLTNQYDPTTSPYYQAVKAESARNLEATQKNIASNSAGGGRYWGGSRLKEQGRAATDQANSLNTMLGGMSERERQNRLSVIPQALGLAQAEQDMPLKKATAFQTLGALPRSIQQAMDSGNYSDFLRRFQDYPFQIGSLASGVQTPPTYQQNPPGFLQQLTGGMAGGVGQGASMAMMLKLLPMLGL